MIYLYLTHNTKEYKQMPPSNLPWYVSKFKLYRLRLFLYPDCHQWRRLTQPSWWLLRPGVSFSETWDFMLGLGASHRNMNCRYFIPILKLALQQLKVVLVSWLKCTKMDHSKIEILVEKHLESIVYFVGYYNAYYF